MRAEGKAVSMALLCRWFGVPRSTIYYRGKPVSRRGRAIDAALVETVRTIIEGNPTTACGASRHS
jgi:putative transposase